MQNKNVNDLIFSAQSHKGLQKGNTNTVDDDVTATLDGSTHSEFKSFQKKTYREFSKKENTSLYSTNRHQEKDKIHVLWTNFGH